MCDVREVQSDEGWKTVAGEKRGLRIDSMNVMMTQLGCSNKSDSMMLPHRIGLVRTIKHEYKMVNHDEN